MSDEEILKGMPDGLRQLLQQVRKDRVDHPEPEMTEEQGEHLAVLLHESLMSAKNQVEAIKAKGGREAQMEAAMVLIEAMAGAFEKAGVTPPIDAQTGLDRRPTLERNGREVVTDIPDDATLRDAPVEVLVDRYLDTAVAAHHAIEYGRVTRHNRFVGRLLKIEKALARRVPDGRRALLPFLSDPHPGIRSFVASACREIVSEQAAAARASVQPRL